MISIYFFLIESQSHQHQYLPTYIIQNTFLVVFESLHHQGQKAYLWQPKPEPFHYPSSAAHPKLP